MSHLNFDRFSDREPSPETPDDARLRRSRAVRSPRVRSLRRALVRGADPSLAMKQWLHAGGDSPRIVRMVQRSGWSASFAEQALQHLVQMWSG